MVTNRTETENDHTIIDKNTYTHRWTPEYVIHPVQKNKINKNNKNKDIPRQPGNRHFRSIFVWKNVYNQQDDTFYQLLFNTESR